MGGGKKGRREGLGRNFGQLLLRKSPVVYIQTVYSCTERHCDTVILYSACGRLRTCVLCLFTCCYILTFLSVVEEKFETDIV